MVALANETYRERREEERDREEGVKRESIVTNLARRHTCILNIITYISTCIGGDT